MNVFWKIIGFFTGILVAIVLPWHIKKVATLQDKIDESMEFATATDVQLFSTEDLVSLFGFPIEKEASEEVSEEELMEWLNEIAKESEQHTVAVKHRMRLDTDLNTMRPVVFNPETQAWQFIGLG